MTPQEIFDKAYLGVIAQGGPSILPNTACAYRSEVNGQKRACGVGQLVDDETAENMDDAELRGAGSTTIDSILDAEENDSLEFQVPTFMRYNWTLLSEIQGAHDSASRDVDDEQFLERYKYNMTEIARQFNLTVPEIPQ